jgi:hypothetical protein
MVQIRLSYSKGTSQETDGLDSYKWYKKHFISALPGLSWCASLAFLEYFDLLDRTIMDLYYQSYTESTPVCPKIRDSPVGKPNKGVSYVGDFIRDSHYMCKILGTLQSTPSNNFKMFHLGIFCQNWGIEESLEFIKRAPGLSEENKVSIINLARSYFTTGPSGVPVLRVEFAEDSSIESTLEKELFIGT